MYLIGSFMTFSQEIEFMSIWSPEAEAGWSFLCTRVSEVWCAWIIWNTCKNVSNTGGWLADFWLLEAEVSLNIGIRGNVLHGMCYWWLTMRPQWLSHVKKDVLVIAIFWQGPKFFDSGMICGWNMKHRKIMILWQVASAVSGIWWRLGDVQKLQV